MSTYMERYERQREQWDGTPYEHSTKKYGSFRVKRVTYDIRCRECGRRIKAREPFTEPHWKYENLVYDRNYWVDSGICLNHVT
jgi:ribosomal protein L44E